MSSRARERASSRDLTIRAAAVGVALTVGVTFLPFVDFAYRGLSLHLVLETVDALTALLVSYLLYGRVRQARRVQDVLLMTATLLLGVTNVAFSIVPAVSGGTPGSGNTAWVSVTLRLVSAGLIAGAAIAPREALASRQVLARILAGVGAGAVALSAVLLSLPPLPDFVDPLLSPERSARPLLAGNDVMTVIQVLDVVLYGLAAVLFSRKAERSHDGLLRWLGAGCALSFFARVNYALFPSLYSEYVYTGDFLRTGFYLLLFVGSLEEIRSYWTARAAVAALEERRRIARDLHDGLAQELAYLHGQLIRHQEDPTAIVRALSAAERALDESRRALAALTRPADEPLATTLARAADEVAGRHDVALRVDLDDRLTVTSEACEQLVRLVREAVGNAARHSGAPEVRLRVLGRPGGGTIEVTDSGRGFDAAAVRAGSFGLQSMRERADELGVTLELVTARGRGTTVRITWGG